MSQAAYNFGVRKALREFGFFKQAEEIVDPETGGPLPEDPALEEAMEAALAEEAAGAAEPDMDEIIQQQAYEEALEQAMIEEAMLEEQMIEEAMIEEAMLEQQMMEEAAQEQAMLEQMGDQTDNPFVGMSDEEVVAYIEQLPPEVQDAVLDELGA